MNVRMFFAEMRLAAVCEQARLRSGMCRMCYEGKRSPLALCPACAELAYLKGHARAVAMRADWCARQSPKAWPA